MLRRSRILAKTISLVAIFLFLGSLALAAPSGAPAAKFTVGDFLVLYAQSIHMTLPPDATPATTYEALRAAKALPSDAFTLNSPLTHADVVRIARAVGVRISSSTPGREFGRAEAELFLETFGNLLGSHGTSSASTGTYAASDSPNPPGDPGNHANTDKGKKKGRPFHSVSEPE